MSEKDQHKGCNCGHEMTAPELLASQAENIINLAFMWMQKDSLDAAEVHLASASKLLSLSGLKDTETHAFYHHARGMMAQKKGHKKSAVRHTRASFAIYESKYPADHYRYAIGQMNFGECLAEAGNPKGRQIMKEGIEKFAAADVGSEEHMLAWKAQTLAEQLRSLERLG